MQYKKNRDRQSTSQVVSQDAYQSGISSKSVIAGIIKYRSKLQPVTAEWINERPKEIDRDIPVYSVRHTVQDDPV